MAFNLNRFPIGSLFRSNASGVLDVVPEPQPVLEPDAPIPDPMMHGPNYVARATEDTTDPATLYSPGSAETHLPSSNSDGDWVDVGREAPIDFRYSHTPSVPSPVPLPQVLPPADAPLQPARASSVFRFVRRPKIFGPAPSEHRSTFPLRVRSATSAGEGTGRGEEVPPHLRVQRAPPFVRPLTGLNHDELGAVYSEIRTWRIQLIEGRAKEDVRWDVLQLGGRDSMSQVAFWTVVLAIAGTLLIGCESFSYFVFPDCKLIHRSDRRCGVGCRNVA